MSQSHALIFDFDDTIAATGHAWRAAERRFLQSLNLAVDESFLDRLNGRSARDIVHLVHTRYSPDASLARSETLFEELLADAIIAAGPPPRPGAIATIHRIAGEHQMAIASGSPKTVVTAAVQRLGLDGIFRCIVSSEEVAEGKPSPLVLLATAERLRLAPAGCVVVEDSLAGVQAARAAGMGCVAVPSRADEAPAIAALAQLTLDSLDQLEPAAIERILRRTPAADAQLSSR